MSIEVLIGKFHHVIVQFVQMVFLLAVLAQLLQLLLNSELPSLLPFTARNLMQFVHLLLLVLLRDLVVVLMQLLNGNLVIVVLPMLRL